MSGIPRRLRPSAAVLVASTLFAALTVLLAVHGFAPFAGEARIHHWVTGHRPAWAVHAAAAVTFLGTGAPPYLAALTAGLLLARHRPTTAGRRDVLATALAPLVVLALGQAVRHGLMLLFARPRPPVADWIAASPSGHAYPSGHAFTSAVAAGLLMWALRRTGRGLPTAAAVAAVGTSAVAVGLTRIYLGVHWPADVLGGWLLAALWLALLLPLLTPGAPLSRATPPEVGPGDRLPGAAGSANGGAGPLLPVGGQGAHAPRHRGGGTSQPEAGGESTRSTGDRRGVGGARTPTTPARPCPGAGPWTPIVVHTEAVTGRRGVR
ncbi:phosphatase PAP2 family protein [Kitasatospora sp. NPDC096147]|uniref:phosphatase PAP2 family protein n=1 Tax=Kitasatospora sp. NPDC096147 TaxID=3364093 RepID=UPI0037F2AD8D